MSSPGQEHDVLIAFGSNLGDPLAQYDRAYFCLIREHQRQSGVLSIPVYSDALQTAPVGGSEDQPPYINGAIRLKTTLSPEDLHAVLIRVEQSLGRERRQRWSARKADLDLLLYDDLQMESEQLTIPHPRMSFRRFVLEPSLQVAADMVHPPSGLSIKDLVVQLNSLPNRITVVVPEGMELNWRPEQLSRATETAVWTIKLVQTTEQFKAESDTSKLVVFPDGEPGDDADSSLMASARAFYGPTLRITGREHADFLTEVTAAIEAMK